MVCTGKVVEFREISDAGDLPSAPDSSMKKASLNGSLWGGWVI
jgi:hypothetical protein